jgi:hypothetical protein
MPNYLGVSRLRVVLHRLRRSRLACWRFINLAFQAKLWSRLFGISDAALSGDHADKPHGEL